MTRLRIHRGDTIELDVGPVRNRAGVVQDISGHTLRFTAKDRLEDPDNLAVLSGSTAGGQITITDGPGGLARVVIPAAASAAFTSDRALYWDVQITDPDGRNRTLDSGILDVVRDVTRAT